MTEQTFNGFELGAPCYEVPNKFYDVLLSAFGSITEVKVALLFIVRTGPHTVAGLSRQSGQSDVSVRCCLLRWAKQGLVQRINLAPELNLETEGGRCAGCDLEYPFMDTHHIQPRAEGGSDNPSNLIDLCPNCHRLMHWRPWELTTAGREWLGLEVEDANS